MAYLGGALGDAPRLWPEHKNFLNTLNQKILKNFWGGGTAPDPFFSGEGTPPPHTPPHWRLWLAPLTSRLWLWPLHKILNTPLLILVLFIVFFAAFSIPHSWCDHSIARNPVGVVNRNEEGDKGRFVLRRDVKYKTRKNWGFRPQ